MRFPARRLALLPTALVLGALACHRLPPSARPVPVDSPLTPDLVREGRDLYVADCAPCHGTDGTGHGRSAAGLRIPPSDLTTLQARHGGEFPREYVMQVVSGDIDVPAHGTREMPVWRRHYGTSGPAAVAAVYAQRNRELLIDHLRTLQRSSGSTP